MHICSSEIPATVQVILMSHNHSSPSQCPFSLSPGGGKACSCPGYNMVSGGRKLPKNFTKKAEGLERTATTTKTKQDDVVHCRCGQYSLERL